MLAKSKVLTMPFPDKLDCQVFWTFGWHYTSSYVFLLFLFFVFFQYMATMRFLCIGSGWNSPPPWNSRIYWLENVTINIVVSRKLVTFQFWVSYSFKKETTGSNKIDVRKANETKLRAFVRRVLASHTHRLLRWWRWCLIPTIGQALELSLDYQWTKERQRY